MHNFLSPRTFPSAPELFYSAMIFSVLAMLAPEPMLAARADSLGLDPVAVVQSQEPAPPLTQEQGVAPELVWPLAQAGALLLAEV